MEYLQKKTEEIQKPKDVLDVVSMIESNSLIKLSGNYSSVLAKRISEEFTKDQQQMYMTSLFCYVNHHSTKDFIVDFNDVWKWIGFDRKGHAKTMLTKNFKQDVDFVIEKGFSASAEKPNGADLGGRPEELIMLNIRTFKKFCMKARTPKADEIHDYFVKLEEIVHETVAEEAKELANMVRLKDQIIKEKDGEIEIKISEKEMGIINNNPKLVYAGYADEEKKTMKFGYTNNAEERLRTHKREIGAFFTYEIYAASDCNVEIEKMIKTDENLKKRIIKDEHETKNGNTVRGKRIGNKIQTEIIKLEPDFTKAELEKLLMEFKDNFDKKTKEELVTENREKDEKIKELETKLKYLEERCGTSTVVTEIENVDNSKYELYLNFLEHFANNHNNVGNKPFELPLRDLFPEYEKYASENSDIANRYDKNTFGAYVKKCSHIIEYRPRIKGVPRIDYRKIDIDSIKGWIETEKTKLVSTKEVTRIVETKLESVETKKANELKELELESQIYLWKFIKTVLDEHKDKYEIFIPNAEIYDNYKNFHETNVLSHTKFGSAIFKSKGIYGKKKGKVWSKYIIINEAKKWIEENINLN